MDDQYWIKKDWRHCDSRLPPACRRAGDHGRPAEVRLQHGPRASLDHEGALFQVMSERLFPGLLPTPGRSAGSVSAGSGVLQGECISGPGVLKRRVSGYLQLQGHKKFHLLTLGNACATREAATVSTPHLWGQERRYRVIPTFSR